MSNVNLSDEVTTLISNFAKVNKISKSKTAALIADVLLASPKTSAGKPVSEESQKVRDYIRKLPKNKQFTSVHVAEKLQVNPTMVNNNLRYLRRFENIVSVAGVHKEAGKRGKPAIIWKTL